MILTQHSQSFSEISFQHNQWWTCPLISSLDMHEQRSQWWCIKLLLLLFPWISYADESNANKGRNSLKFLTWNLILQTKEVESMIWIVKTSREPDKIPYKLVKNSFCVSQKFCLCFSARNFYSPIMSPPSYCVLRDAVNTSLQAAREFLLNPTCLPLSPAETSH